MRKPIGKNAAQGEAATKLLVAMTGKASSAKTADGEEPVFAYIASSGAAKHGVSPMANPS